MNFNEYVKKLQEAHESLETFEQEEAHIIEEEIACLKKLVQRLSPVSSKTTVGGADALLIYVFSTKKEWVSTEVYITNDGHAVYQVYDEEKYRGYVRNAVIKDGFVYMPIAKFLRHVSLEDIFSFFTSRPDYLYDYAGELKERNKQRSLFVEKMKRLL